MELTVSHFQTSDEGDEHGSQNSKKRKSIKGKYPWKRQKNETFFEVAAKETFYNAKKQPEEKKSKVASSLCGPENGKKRKQEEENMKGEETSKKDVSETNKIKSSPALRDQKTEKVLKEDNGSKESSGKPANKNACFGGTTSGETDRLDKFTGKPTNTCFGRAASGETGKRNKFTGSDRSYSRISKKYNADSQKSKNEVKAKYHRRLQGNKSKCK